MSDAYLPLLLANMQQTVVGLRQRVQALEEQMASLSEPQEYDDEEAAQAYMDGTPVL